MSVTAQQRWGEDAQLLHKQGNLGGTFQQKSAVSTLPRGVLCEEELFVPSWKLTCSWTKLLSAKLGLCSKSSLPHHPRTASFISPLLISPFYSLQQTEPPEGGFSYLLDGMSQFHLGSISNILKKLCTW